MAKKATTKMTATICGNNHPLYIGFGFLNDIQKLETEEYGGLEMALLGLLEGDPLTVRTVLQAALTTSDEISEADIDQYIEQEMDIDKFCKDFLKLLESANLTKTRYKKMMPILKELKEAADQELKKVPAKIKEQIQKITTEELSTTTK